MDAETQNNNKRADWSNRHVSRWIPYVENFFPTKKKYNSSVRIGSILGKRLYYGLHFESELIVLTPENWQSVVNYAKLDFLLVESCSHSVTGDFNLAGLELSPNTDIFKIITSARKKGIPTIFWNTKDALYHEHYLEISRIFDFVFCADSNEIDLLKKSGISSELLLPAIQPAIYNPLNVIQNEHDLEIGVLVDGISDLFQFDDTLSVLKDISTGHGLTIIDSNKKITQKEIESLSGVQSNILGSAGYLERIIALKSSRVSAFFQNSIITPTEQTWMVLESLACKVPVLYFGELPENDMRQGLVKTCSSGLSFMVELAHYFERSIYRNDIAHARWKKVMSMHSFSHRIEQICEKIDIAEKKETEFPNVAINIFTSRSEVLHKSVDMFNSQNYPNKELFITYSGNKEKTGLDINLENTEGRLNVICQKRDILDKKRFVFGNSKSEVKYIFNFNVEDYYDKEYISDIMLYNKIADFFYIGKPSDRFIFKNKGGECHDEKGMNSLFGSITRQMNSDQSILSGKLNIFGSKKENDCIFIVKNTGLSLNYEREYTSTVTSGIHSVNVIEDADLKTLFASRVIANQKNAENYLSYKTIQSSITNGFQQKGDQRQLVNKRKPRILYIGPGQFSQGVWETRADYIFPDLFEPIHQHAEIHMLTGPIPGFAKGKISELQKRYKILFHSVSKKRKKSSADHWLFESCKYAFKINPDIVTNVFGTILLGFVGAQVASAVGARYIQRVSADEVAVRLALGIYKAGSKEHVADLRKEMSCYDCATEIIAMSTWEQQRIQKICIDKNKVKVCIRGINMKRFSTKKIKESYKVRKCLFLGRKSKEKGYDIIEKAAMMLEKGFPDLEFIFAGTFDRSVEGNRRYIGFVESDKLPQLYEDVDALILSSRTEGMPQVVMEAMAMNVPCIVSRHLFGTIFIDEKEALLTELDPTDLAKQIIKLYRNERLAENIAKNAQIYAQKHFSRKYWRNVYKEIVLGL